jgi:hypothetical protein
MVGKQDRESPAINRPMVLDVATPLLPLTRLQCGLATYSHGANAVSWPTRNALDYIFS